MYFLHKVILGGLVYPFTYDMVQIYKLGAQEYFSSFKKILDFMFVWSGLAVVVVMNVLPSITPFHILPKVLLLLTIFTSVPKTF